MSSEIDGDVPDSIQATVNLGPAGRESRAAGVVKRTSASARGTSKEREVNSRIVEQEEFTTTVCAA